MYIMNTMEIVKDAIRYPLSDWKKIFILGIIIVINAISVFLGSVGAINSNIIWILTSMGFIIGFLVNGYMFRIVKSSLNGKIELPEFNDWLNMGIDGIKVFIAFIVYSIPVILVLLSIYMTFPYEKGFFNPFALLINPLISVISNEILNLIALLFNIFGYFILPLSYVIIIIPIFLVAIANMAYYEGEFKSAFKIREIIEEISIMGWINLIKLYVMLITIVLIYIITGNVITYIFSFVNLNFVDTLVAVLFYLILTSYFYMILARSVGLFYMPDKED